MAAYFDPILGLLRTKDVGTGGGASYTFSTGLTNSANTITANISTGINGGQSAIGGTASGNSLQLISTSHATKGSVYHLGAGSVATNTAFGNGALVTNTTGARNTAYGNLSLNLNTTTSDSTSFGYSALQKNIGNRNSAFGSLALTNHTSGEFNIAFGKSASELATSTANNTCIGSYSNYSNLTGTDNVMLGYSAGYYETGSNSLYIDNQARANLADGKIKALIYGVFDLLPGNQLLTVNGNLSVQGVPVSSTSLSVYGQSATAFTFTAKFKNSGGLLSLQVRDDGSVYNLGAGSITTNTAFGDGVLINNTSGNSNTGIGYQALTGNTTGSENIAIGYQALTGNTTGDNNIAISYQALMSNTTGRANLAIGEFTLRLNTTGSENIAIGNASLATNTTGSDNIGIGISTLTVNTTGGDNIGIGYYSLNKNTIGSMNIAIGQYCLTNNTGGANNTAIGNSAGRSNLTGTDNVMLGYSAGYYETGSNSLYIDNQARANLADGKIKALIYGVFDASVANQRLRFNANIAIGGGAPTSTSPLNISNIPTSSVGLSTGDIWSNLGILTIV